MQPKLSFLMTNGVQFARIVSDERDITVAVEAHDENAVRQAAADFRATAARLIERAVFIESALGRKNATGDIAMPWCVVNHPMLAGVFALKRTVTDDAAQVRTEYVGFMDTPTCDPNKAVNFAWHPNAVTKAAWLNSGTVMETRASVTRIAEHQPIRATA